MLRLIKTHKTFRLARHKLAPFNQLRESVNLFQSSIFKNIQEWFSIENATAV